MLHFSLAFYEYTAVVPILIFGLAVAVIRPRYVEKAKATDLEVKDVSSSPTD